MGRIPKVNDGGIESETMNTPTPLFKVVCLLLLTVPAAPAQQLTIQKDSSSQTVLSAPDIAALPHITVKVTDHDGPATFSGVPLATILQKAGVIFGESLRGKRLASCLLVEAADNYRVVIALPELDPGFTDKQILLVDQREGKPLGDKEGPFRIIILEEKRMARWVRQVKTLKIVDIQ
jgi:hypothetical protein